MKPLYKAYLAVIPAIALLILSCSKGGNDNNPDNCNNVLMKLKKWQATFDDEHYIEATWNSDGTIATLKVNVPLSDYSTADYIYSGGKITQAVLHRNFDGVIYDTVVFRYNAEGKVDSMYRKLSPGFGIRLSYSNGKIVRYTRYDGPNDIMFYWDIETDANDNISKATEYWNESGTYEKQSIMTFTRDTKKNPLAGLAPYMMYLDDDYQAFWYWGPNNYTDQRYQDFTGTGTDLITGYKFKYDGNCYPASSQNTILGQTIFADDDFIFTYY